MAGTARRRPDGRGWVALPVATLLVLGSLVGIAPARAGAATAKPHLDLEPAPAVTASALPPATADKLVDAPRARFVDLDASAIRAQLGAERITLPLFPDVRVPLVADGPVRVGANGSLTWSGTVEGSPGYATLTFTDDALHADVLYRGIRYDLTPVGGARHLVTVEDRAFPADLEVPTPPATASDPLTAAATPAAPAPDLSASATRVITLLTWYDARAVAWFGGDALANAELTATINETNAAYARSGVSQSLVSVGIEPASQSGSGSAVTDLSHLAGSGDGVLDAVHARRNALGADLVAFVTTLDDACGVAYLPPGTPSAATSPYGFAVVHAMCARGNYSFAHELGHTMGAGHGGAAGGGLYPYSNGYVDSVHGFRTIMAYDECGCPRVPYFSSATVRYDGWPTGSATADNARTLNATAAGVAGYRGPPTTPPPNDDFASATVWAPGSANPASGTNRAATKQAGEPLHAGNAGGASVWWRFTATEDALVSVSTAGSSFDTVLGVYTGASVAALTPVASNDDSNGSIQSSVQIDASAGTTYLVAVDGYGGTTGSIELGIHLSALAGSRFHPLTPARVQDSRPAGPQVGPYGTPWAAGTTRTVQVAGAGGVAADATAVSLNVTVTNPTAAGHLTLWPAGSARPLASNLNWAPSRTVANAVTVGVGAAGAIAVFSSAGSTDVVIDIVGYYSAGAGDGYTAVAPTRIQDSRPSGPQAGPYATPWGPASSRTVQVGGAGGVPAGASAAVLNVTVTNPTAAGHLVVWPTGQPRPLASSLNWTPGQTVPNAVTVPLGDGGRISVFSSAGSTDVVIDVVGWFAPGTGVAFHPSTPDRILDSRPGAIPLDPYDTPWVGTDRPLQLTGNATIPASAVAVLVNATATNPSLASHLVVWPWGRAAPLASSLNWTAGLTVPNAVTVMVGSGGRVGLRNQAGAVDLVADVTGWYG